MISSLPLYGTIADVIKMLIKEALQKNIHTAMTAKEFEANP